MSCSSGAGLILSLPVWAAIALAIKLDDGGDVFYSQPRVGEGGRVFRVFKFRSMVPDADARGAHQAAAGDPRITRVGRWLRATAMDELPQLWSIFRGDMSFVGPRALRPGEIEVSGGGQLVALEAVPGFDERCRVPPGLTGVAQIYAPRDIPQTTEVPVRPRLHPAAVDSGSIFGSSSCRSGSPSAGRGKPGGENSDHAHARRRRHWRRARRLDDRDAAGRTGPRRADARGARRDRHARALHGSARARSLRRVRPAARPHPESGRYGRASGARQDSRSRFAANGSSAAIIDRAALDVRLAKRATRRGRRNQVRMPGRVGGRRTSGRPRDCRGLEQGVTARACVLACGANYRFHRPLGLGLPDVFLQSAQLETTFPETSTSRSGSVARSRRPGSRGSSRSAAAARRTRASA